MLTRLLAGLSRRDRRTIAVGTGVIVCIVLVGKGGPAWEVWQSDTIANATELATEAARADAAIAVYPVMRDSLHARQARLRSLDTLIVDGVTPSAAAVTLASLLNADAVDAGLKAGAIDPRVDSATTTTGRSQAPAPGTFVPISVRGEATGDVVGIAQFLAELEDGTPLIAVRSVSMTQQEATAPADHMETIHVEFTVAALSRRPFSPSPSRPAVKRPHSDAMVAHDSAR